MNILDYLYLVYRTCKDGSVSLNTITINEKHY